MPQRVVAEGCRVVALTTGSRVGLLRRGERVVCRGDGVETDGSDGSFLGSDVDSVIEMEAVDEGNSNQEWQQVKGPGKKSANKRGISEVRTESDKDSDAKRAARQIDMKVKVQFDSPSSYQPPENNQNTPQSCRDSKGYTVKGW